MNYLVAALQLTKISKIDYLVYSIIDEEYKITDYLYDAKKYNLIYNYKNLILYFNSNISNIDKIKYSAVIDYLRSLLTILNEISSINDTNKKLSMLKDFYFGNRSFLLLLYMFMYKNKIELAIKKSDGYYFSLEKFVYYVINKPKLEKLKNINLAELIHSSDEKTKNIILKIIELKQNLKSKI